MKEVEKIAFYGLSGSGKTTAIEYIKGEHKKIIPGYKIVILNVGEPLHKIQAYAYELFAMENRGQDGKLLQFLAKHFEERLGPTFLYRLDKILDSEKNEKLLIVNGDVRNNAYPFLREANFLFIHVLAKPEAIGKRLKLRGDVARFNTRDDVEWIDEIKGDFVLENYGTIGEYKKKIDSLVKKLFFER